MVFHTAKLRVKELAVAINVDSAEIIAICTLLKIPASSPLSSLSIEQCKKIINYLKEDDKNNINNQKLKKKKNTYKYSN